MNDGAMGDSPKCAGVDGETGTVSSIKSSKASSRSFRAFISGFLGRICLDILRGIRSNFPSCVFVMLTGMVTTTSESLWNSSLGYARRLTRSHRENPLGVSAGIDGRDLASF